MSSKIIVSITFWNFRTLTILMHGSKRKFVSWVFFQKGDIFHGELGWRKRTSKFVERWIWISRQIKFNKIFWIFRLLSLWRKDQKKCFFNSTILHSCSVVGWDLDGRNQTNSYGEKGVWVSIKIITNSTFYKIIKLLMKGTKSILLQWSNPPQRENIQLRPILEI